jgi:hypothetical protein
MLDKGVVERVFEVDNGEAEVARHTGKAWLIGKRHRDVRCNLR